MAPKPTNKFSATDATLGYLYQVRYALLLALQRLREEPEFSVSVETLDDVTFETAGIPSDLLQTKHHREGVASLTDASPDLWKTLRIWFELDSSHQIPPTTRLCLVTTGTAAEGSAALRLTDRKRDVPTAQAALDSVASSSTSEVNKKAYQAYLNASATSRAAILDRVLIIDAAPTISDLDADLTKEVYWAAGKKHHAAFLDRLEGWWFRRVLRQLTNHLPDRIGSVELEAQMADPREQFKPDALPIDEDLLQYALDEATKVANDNSTFVRQLLLVKAGNRRIAAAIRDYYRAFVQRSRWLRDDLVVDIDLHKYEKRLTEEWELVFEAMRDELGTEATQDVQEAAARSVLKWAEQATIPIRPSVTEPFITRGSLHMLSDGLRIGWHPEFRKLLASVITHTQENP